MDKIQKALNRLSDKEKRIVKEVLDRLQNNDLLGLDLQKLKGHQDLFRVRKGDLRIIYRKLKSQIMLVAIERRSEKTYRDF